MTVLREQNQSDQFVDLANFNAMVRMVNDLASVSYDTRVFSWQGRMLTLAPFLRHPREWEITKVGPKIVYIRSGHVKWSDVWLPLLDEEDVDYQVDFTDVPVNEKRFMFLEINKLTGTVTPKIDAVRLADTPAESIVRFLLGEWKMTALGPTLIMEHFGGGAIQLHNIYS